MIHLTIQQLSSHLDGELATASEALVAQHLAACEACSSKLSRLKEQDGDLIRVLTGLPGDTFSERLSQSLEEKTRSNGRRVMAPPAGRAEAEVPEPAGAAAPVESASRAEAAAGVTLSPRSGVPRREEPLHAEPGLRSAPAFRAAPAATHAPRWRTRVPGKKASFPWAAVLFVGAMVGSVGAVKSGIGLVTRWLESSPPANRKQVASGRALTSATGSTLSAPGSTAQTPAPVAAPPGMGAASPAGTAAPADPKGAPPGPAPSRDEADGPWRVDESGIDAERTLRSAAERSTRAAEPESGAARESPPAAAEGSTDSLRGVFAAIDEAAKSAVRTAQRLDREAAANPTAEGYDAAAAEWERTVSVLRGDAYREASLRRAEAKYRAWLFERNDARATGAAGAIRAYLVSAPSGPERQKVTGWLAEVEHARFR